MAGFEICSSSRLCQLRECAQTGEWDGAAQLVAARDSSHDCVGFVALRAAQDHQWDLVMQLIERGVDGNVRNSLLHLAVAHHHVQCTAELLKVGASLRTLLDDLCGEMASEHGKCFILELMKATKHVHMTVGVLIVSVGLEQWWLVYKLMVMSEIWTTQMCKILRDMLSLTSDIGSQPFGHFAEYVSCLPETCQFSSSHLFHFAIHHRIDGLINLFCEHGISQEDLKYAAHWFLVKEADCEGFARFCENLKKRERNWLRPHTITLTMDNYFQLKSDASLKTFIEQFPDDFQTPAICNLFREAVEKSIKLDCVDCFVALCKKRCRVYKQSQLATKFDDLVLAYTFAIKERPEFISKLFEEKIAEHFWFSLDEILMLLDIIVKRRVWEAFPHFFSGLSSLQINGSPEALRVFEHCVRKMLPNQSAWPHIVPGLDQLIKGEWLQDAMEFNKFLQSVAPQYSQKLDMMSSMKQWCLDNRHANVAFVLAWISKDWTFAAKVARTLPSLDLCSGTLLAAVYQAVKEGSFSPAAGMLTACPLNAEMFHFCPFLELRGHQALTEACEEQGLLDHALVIMHEDGAYIREHHERCQDPNLLNLVLKVTVDKSRTIPIRWDIVGVLMSRCTDLETLKFTMWKAVVAGKMDIVKYLINVVDVATCTLLDGCCSLLCVAMSNSFSDDTVREKMFRLLLASGLSTFQKNVVQFQTLRCSMTRNFLMFYPDILVLMIDCGTYSLNTLHRLACKTRSNGFVSVNESVRVCCQCIEDAAATPPRLDHLARLVVSHTIGCRPVRAERIKSLDIPVRCKDLINFVDEVQRYDAVKRLKEQAAAQAN